MVRRISSLLTLMLLLAALNVTADNSSKEEAALSAAQAWLTMIDEGSYGKSWANASTLFKSLINKQAWEEALRSVRTPLGPVISRSITSKIYTDSLPDAPDGNYVVIRFSTSFENIESATETITMMLDIDNAWRASGYYIK